MIKFLTGSKLKYLLKIIKVSPFSYGHAMEEFAELQIECSKMDRNIGRPDKLKKELGDAFFHLLKLMFRHNITMDDLIDDLILETLDRFPEQIKEVNINEYN